MTRKKTATPPVNEQLRAWTRGLSFSLSMGKRQVMTLVLMHRYADTPYPECEGKNHPWVTNWTTYSRCLEDRGLVVHLPSLLPMAERRRIDHNSPFGAYWQLTPAGTLVIALLKESGVYQEIESEIQRWVRERTRPRLVG